MSQASINSNRKPYAKLSQGARIVFFSGGTALGTIAKTLKNYTHNATYIITPFDSGGSSAILRRTFNMPAIGDFRARLITLIDPSIQGYTAITKLFGYRFPKAPSCSINLRQELQSLASGKHPLIASIPETKRSRFLHYIQIFYKAMPPDMSLYHASVGNIILTGAYLEYDRQLERVLKEFSILLQTHGNIQTIATTSNTHLCTRLENNEIRLGQHSFTGKETTPITAPIPAPIKDIWLTQSLEDATAVNVDMAESIQELIMNADLICYPIGSFYSSLIANLLPKGVSQVLCKTPCPKVFIPNICADPELLGHSLQSQLTTLLTHATRNKANTSTNTALNTILIDVNSTRYAGGIPHDWLIRHGVAIHQTELVSDTSAPFIDAEKVCDVLMTLCR